jgi:AraC-like DNA-binding protein
MRVSKACEIESGAQCGPSRNFYSTQGTSVSSRKKRQSDLSEQASLRSICSHDSTSVKELFLSIRSSPRFTQICEYRERHLLAARLEVEKSDGEGYWDLLQIAHSIYLVIGNVVYADTGLKSVLSDGLLSFHVRLSGEVTVLVNRTSSVRVGGPSLLVWHQPPGLNSGEQELPGCRVVSVTLYCDPEFITNALADAPGAVPRHIDRFLAKGARGINYSHLPINAEILNVATELAYSPYTGRLRLIYLEAKALELYCQIVAALDRLADLASEHYSEVDLMRLQKARGILTTRFKPVPRTPEIAREIGINETKLKRGFKALFGKPVHEYGRECRMQHAMQLLRDRHMPISRVTEEAGYKHQTTFANAFKQRFGYRPKDVRVTQILEDSRLQAADGDAAPTTFK